jgi:hypothetical protein
MPFSNANEAVQALSSAVPQLELETSLMRETERAVAL